LTLAPESCASTARGCGFAQQSLQILHMLVERPGELVLREEICSRLRPVGTVVEFDSAVTLQIIWRKTLHAIWRTEPDGRERQDSAGHVRMWSVSQWRTSPPGLLRL
jgi:hypothetical protein